MTSAATSVPFSFISECLHCKEAHFDQNYLCSCGGEAWRREYRNLDFRLRVDKGGGEAIRQSFRNFDFDSPKGILQYLGLPGRDYASEDILKVGATPLLRLQRWEQSAGIKVWIKSEGHNPSGCFKDRETLMCFLHLRRKAYHSAVIYSSGNAAASAAIFAQKYHLPLITFVPGDTYPEKINYIIEHGSDVVVIGDTNTNFEMGYRLFARVSASAYFIDSGYDNWSVINPYRVEGDKTIALEIVRQFSEGESYQVPDFVIVPTANGSCMAGVWKGFKELHQLGLIDKLPRMVSAGIKNANPVLKAVKQRQCDRPVVCDLSELSAADASIGSIILAQEGYDSIQATRAVLDSGGEAVGVQRADIVNIYQEFLAEEAELASNKDILPEPASLISVAAIRQLRSQQLIKNGSSVVCVVTGSGFKARKKIAAIMADDPEGLHIAGQILERKARKQYPTAPKEGRKIVVEPNEKSLLAAFDKLKS